MGAMPSGNASGASASSRQPTCMHALLPPRCCRSLPGIQPQTAECIVIGEITAGDLIVALNKTGRAWPSSLGEAEECRWAAGLPANWALLAAPWLQQPGSAARERPPFGCPSPLLQ